MAYEFATGHDNEAGLSVVSIQPSCRGIQVNVVRDGRGFAKIKGKGTLDWLYDPSLPAGDFAALLTEFGLNYFDTPSVDCTLRTTLNDEADEMNREFGVFNATLTIPPAPQFQFFWKPIAFHILIDLEQL